MKMQADTLKPIRTHLFMLVTCSPLMVFSAVAAFSNSSMKTTALAASVLFPASLLPAIIRQDRHEFEERDAALILPWILLLIFVIPAIVGISAKMHFPLHDSFFKNADHALGFNVPAIVNWSVKHPYINSFLSYSYDSIYLLLPAACLLPALLGKKEAAERFLISNTIAFLIALPIFTAFPAVGPWVGHAFPPSPEQKACEASILALHGGGQGGPIGIVSFPSFHVIWAALSAIALWNIKPLRTMASATALLIVISTVTTGWHYASDVIGGLLVAAAAVVCADIFYRQKQHASATAFRFAAVNVAGAEGKQ